MDVGCVDISLRSKHFETPCYANVCVFPEELVGSYVRHNDC